MSADLTKAEMRYLLKQGAMVRALTVYNTDGDRPTISSWKRREDGKWVVFAPAISTQVFSDRELEAFLAGVKAGKFNGGV